MPKTTQEKDDAWEALEAAYQEAAREGRGGDFLDDLHRKRVAQKKADKKKTHRSSDPRYRLISQEDWTGFLNQREVYFPAVYKLRAVKAREAERARQNGSEPVASSSANTRTSSRSRRMKLAREPYNLRSRTVHKRCSPKPPGPMKHAEVDSSSQSEDSSMADDDDEAGSQLVEKHDEENDSAVDSSSIGDADASDAILSKANSPCSRSSTIYAGPPPSSPEMRAGDGQLSQSHAPTKTMSPPLPGSPPPFVDETGTQEPTEEGSTQSPAAKIEENLDVWMNILRKHHDFAHRLTARLLSDTVVFGKPEHRLLASIVQLATAVKQPATTLPQTRALIQRVNQKVDAFFNNILSVD